mmetsp:Transcript_18656/g.26806  ORF Transcript_18656/g.26806 Transcript_18656/m.26806 type:complete len:224 (-) Transcript_18656:56-727(-)|eukprot:CAMPEP_0202446254 /NCGR_PEP_ID=MMETSP1360-20130828/4813_1 /ASSEMBLY_ACC=CAM_ASM_000848 /TAXON_ID=515479 /ORGANISM="Licmophora paradoxa, Strain CCMP2313" /LENGTH=223 /DNA_ID=CAMNT_0049062699 /DNA_START=31 /DNA_END=702 /DNA_ORIENTATION=+
MSSYSSNTGNYLQNLVLDSSSSTEQKVDCLKLMKVVIKNLADPIKAQDAKYRQLKLENPKVATKILPCPSALDYLKSVGFTETIDETGAKLLKIEKVDAVKMTASLQEVTNALTMVTPKDGSIASACKKARYVEEKKEETAGSRPKTVLPVKFSEKQKARMLMEEKEKKEREAAKAERKRNALLLKRDKFVRENDSNWTSGVSAAAAKSGTGMSTFRDRYGES